MLSTHHSANDNGQCFQKAKIVRNLEIAVALQQAAPAVMMARHCQECQQRQ
jgi:hypothetical protein